MASFADEGPVARRAPIARVPALVRQNFPDGFRAAIPFRMIAWEVPLGRYPQAYKGKGRVGAALAARKHSRALLLSCSGLHPAPTRRAAR